MDDFILIAVENCGLQWAYFLQRAERIFQLFPSQISTVSAETVNIAIDFYVVMRI